MQNIKVTNLNKKRKIVLKDIKELALFVLFKKTKVKNFNINIVFLTDAKIKKIHKEFKHKDTSTDVLCFCLFEGLSLKGIKKEHSADIYISLDTAHKNSKIYKTKFIDEVYLYVIHGLLHMLGYRDNKNLLRTKMENEQSRLLKIFSKSKEKL